MIFRSCFRIKSVDSRQFHLFDPSCWITVWWNQVVFPTGKYSQTETEVLMVLTCWGPFHFLFPGIGMASHWAHASDPRAFCTFGFSIGRGCALRTSKRFSFVPTFSARCLCLCIGLAECSVTFDSRFSWAPEGPRGRISLHFFQLPRLHMIMMSVKQAEQLHMRYIKIIVITHLIVDAWVFARSHSERWFNWTVLSSRNCWSMQLCWSSCSNWTFTLNVAQLQAVYRNMVNVEMIQGF